MAGRCSPVVDGESSGPRGHFQWRNSNYYQAAEVKAVTEHRPGTYIYCDRMMAGYGFGTLDDCALTVLATVVSRPTENRAVVDTGSKSLGSDRCDAQGMGHLVEYPDAIITTLNERTRHDRSLSLCQQTCRWRKF